MSFQVIDSDLCQSLQFGGYFKTEQGGGIEGIGLVRQQAEGHFYHGLDHVIQIRVGRIGSETGEDADHPETLADLGDLITQGDRFRRIGRIGIILHHQVVDLGSSPDLGNEAQTGGFLSAKVLGIVQVQLRALVPAADRHLIGSRSRIPAHDAILDSSINGGDGIGIHLRDPGRDDGQFGIEEQRIAHDVVEAADRIDDLGALQKDGDAVCVL